MKFHFHVLDANRFGLPVIYPEKFLQEVGTNAQVSGMCLLHADTSADLSERERPLPANFSG